MMRLSGYDQTQDSRLGTMHPVRTLCICKECGNLATRRLGRCPSCEGSGTLVEIVGDSAGLLREMAERGKYRPYVCMWCGHVAQTWDKCPTCGRFLSQMKESDIAKVRAGERRFADGSKGKGGSVDRSGPHLETDGSRR